MFVEQRWNILHSLSQQDRSPLQLAQSLNTTMANISQQLRLLEASHLVTKHKIKNRDKGLPRSIFSLKDNHVYFVSGMHNHSEKKLATVSAYEKIILKIWFLDNNDIQMPLQRLLWHLKPFLTSIATIAFDQEKDRVLVVSDSKDVARITEKNDEIEAKIIDEKQLSKMSSVITLHEDQSKRGGPKIMF